MQVGDCWRGLICFCGRKWSFWWKRNRMSERQNSFFFTGWEITGSQQVILVHCAKVVVTGLWFGKHYELNHTAAQCDTSNKHTSPLQTTSLMHPSTTSCNSLKIAVFNFGHIPEKHVTASGWGGGWWVANVWVWISKVYSGMFGLIYHICIGKSLIYCP